MSFQVHFEVDGRACALSMHAAERYWQRVRPGLPTFDAAVTDLVRVVAAAGILRRERPGWLTTAGDHDERPGRRSEQWILLGDDIVLPVIRGFDGFLVATTCLSRHGTSEPVQARRAQKRRAESQRRRTRRKTSQPTGSRPRRAVLEAFERDFDLQALAYQLA